MINTEIIQRIKAGPTLLFLGQKYLSLESGEDIFLTEVIKKYSTESLKRTPSYDQILDLNINSKIAGATAWMDKLAGHIAIPLWLKIVSRLNWSSVYTSAIDTVLERAMQTDYRTVQPVYNEAYQIKDPRSKLNLHLTYLFGSVAHSENESRPPFTEFEKMSRVAISNILLQRIPEILTTKGVMVIDGYDPDNDWLSVETLFGLVSRLGQFQAILCNVDEHVLQNKYIKALQTSEKLLTTTQPLANLIAEAESFGFNFGINNEQESGNDKWTTIGDQAIKIPKRLFYELSKTATIIDDSFFVNEDILDQDAFYQQFKDFLGAASLNSIWKNFPLGFAFERDYFKNLKSEVEKFLWHKKQHSHPIILYGQSSSGKTIALGWLAYQAKKEYNNPLLFIQKKILNKADIRAVDNFCRWGEENGTDHTLIIWDGMAEKDQYYKLIQEFKSRGRNIVLVGSAYDVGHPWQMPTNFIESPINLDDEERRRFKDYLVHIDPELEKLSPVIVERNVLAMFYRHLPETRQKIRQGLKSEFESVLKFLRAHEETTSRSKSKPTLYELLHQAGLITTNLEENENIQLKGEIIPQPSFVDNMLYSVLVPGEFALDVPYELLVRTLGRRALESPIFRILNRVSLIIWNEDNDGNFAIGARTSVEAEILSNYLGSLEEKVEYIINLLENIRYQGPSSSFFESNNEINFATKLLEQVGPKSKRGFNQFLAKIATVLGELRKERLAYHPRLVLKEANYLRAIAKDLNENGGDPSETITIYQKAEKIILNALEDFHDLADQPIMGFLKVEYATILGYKATVAAKTGESTIDVFELYQEMKEIIPSTFASKPENFYALDVRAWTSENLLKDPSLTSSERLDVIASMSSLFEQAEGEGISDENLEDFAARKMKFHTSAGKLDVAESIYQELLLRGSTAGIYWKAQNIFHSRLDGDQSEESSFHERSKQTFDFLTAQISLIEGDDRCLYLLFKSWWGSKTGLNGFYNNRYALPFSKEDWRTCLNLVNRVLFVQGSSGLPVIRYIKGIAEFHLEDYSSSDATFKELDYDTDFSEYGNRRLVKSFVASTPQGQAQEFTGSIEETIPHDAMLKRGKIYVRGLHKIIPFILNDFHRETYNRGDAIGPFYIGFSFRGPIAINFKK